MLLQEPKAFDNILQIIGWGKYQVLNAISAFIMATILGVHIMSPIFIAYPMDFECDMEEQEFHNETFTILPAAATLLADNYVITEDQCYVINCNTTSCPNNTAKTDDVKKETCSRFQFSEISSVESSIVREFNLICDRTSYIYVLQSVFMVGVFLNGLFFGKLSDRLGRKMSVILMAVATLALSLGISFVTSVELYIVLRALVGLFCFTFPTTCVLTSETCPSTKRSVVVIVQSSGVTFGIALLVGFAYFIRTWRYLQIAISLLFLITIILACLFDESPRWLVSRNRSNEAMKILRKIARINNTNETVEEELNKFEEVICSETTKILGNSDGRLLMEENCTKKKAEKSVENLGMSDTLRYAKLRTATFIMTFTWFSISCVYYGLSLNVSSIGGDIYINSLLMGALGVTFGILSIFACIYMGRRALVSSCLLLCGFFCTALCFLPEDFETLRSISFHTGRLLDLVSFQVMYLYTIEIYPTVLRSTAVNFGSSFARVGSMVTPFIAMLHLVFQPLPYMVFGLIMIMADDDLLSFRDQDLLISLWDPYFLLWNLCFCCVVWDQNGAIAKCPPEYAGILVLLLPETKDHHMHETIEQAENFIANAPSVLTCCNLSTKRFCC